MRVLMCLWLLCACAANAHAAPDPLAGACPVCHGAASAAVPPLDALSAAQIEAALRAYRDGSLPGTAMPRLAAALSDGQIAALAARFGRAP